MRALVLKIAVGLALIAPQAALAQTPEDEAAVHAVIADWYERVSHTPAKTPWSLLAPGGVDGGPGYSVPTDLDSGAAVIRGPFLNRELAARALQFNYEITSLKLDPRFAKAFVWERGYFYASAVQRTYENAASTIFVLEKLDSGEWKILLHEANSVGIPPNKITDPMPDLRGLYYQRCSTCDPAADAKKAASGAW